MKKYKWYLITGSVCLLIGVGSGLGIMYGILKPTTVPGSNIITTGDTDKIKIRKVIVYKDRIIIKTEATGSGAIQATINKKEICPELERKDIISVSANTFYQDKSFYLGYNLNYQHIFLNRIVFGAGVNINQNLLRNTISGYGASIHLGILF